MDVRWNMPGESVSGQGQVVNISSSGLLLQMDSRFKPSDDCVVALDAPVHERAFPFSNKKGKVVWFRRIDTTRFKYQCGVEFLEDKSDGQDVKHWVDARINELSQTADANILNNYAA